MATPKAKLRASMRRIFPGKVAPTPRRLISVFHREWSEGNPEIKRFNPKYKINYNSRRHRVKKRRSRRRERPKFEGLFDGLVRESSDTEMSLFVKRTVQGSPPRVIPNSAHERWAGRGRRFDE
ncbi:hypothetical protein K0M31_007376 [Melipona bicolor]|uniref:Uncharacterized protein n=1 Tax=Melipona bicolor TaxID=60889 RepID=A0AA40KVR1_9HYME|nr:hypothetical protein K0M31_007376 [Melipona bicolor]